MGWGAPTRHVSLIQFEEPCGLSESLSSSYIDDTELLLLRLPTRGGVIINHGLAVNFALPVIADLANMLRFPRGLWRQLVGGAHGAARIAGGRGLLNLRR